MNRVEVESFMLLIFKIESNAGINFLHFNILFFSKYLLFCDHSYFKIKIRYSRTGVLPVFDFSRNLLRLCSM